MASKGQPKSSKPLFPRHAIQAHKPVLFIGEGVEDELLDFGLRLSALHCGFSRTKKSEASRKRSKMAYLIFSFDTP